MKKLIVLLISLFYSTYINEPVIGLLVYRIHNILKYPKSISDKYSYYVPYSNVKFIEQAGGKVIPIKYDLEGQELNNMLDKVNGIFMPGSFDNIYDQNRSLTSAAIMAFKVFDYVIQYNHNTGKNIPILGVCFGMQAMIAYYCQKNNTPNRKCIDYFYIEKQSLELTPTDWLNKNYNTSMFSQLSKSKFDAIKYNRITYNWHLYSILVKTFNEKLSDVKDKFHILTTSKGKATRTTNPDANSGDEFISSMQHATLPWYGLQYHPEKPLFEMYPQKQYPGIVSNHDVALLSQSIANFFVEQCRTLNDRILPEKDLLTYTIYNQQYTFIKSLMTTVFVMN